MFHLGASRKKAPRARIVEACGRTAANASLPQRCSSRVHCGPRRRGRPLEGFRAESPCPTSAPAGGPLADETPIEGVMVDGAPRRSSKRERSRLTSCKALRSWNRLAEKHHLRLYTTSARRSAPAPRLPSINRHRKRQERSSRPRLSVQQASRPRASPTSSRPKSSH